MKKQQGDIESRAKTLGLLLLGYELGLDYPSWVTGCDVEILQWNIPEDASQQCILKPDFLKVPAYYITGPVQLWNESGELGRNGRLKVQRDSV